MSSTHTPKTTAEVKPVSSSLPAVGTPAQKGAGAKGKRVSGSSTASGGVREGFDPDPESALSVNWASGYGVSTPAVTLDIIRRFLMHQGVSALPRGVEDLFPSDWRVGKTPVPLEWDTVGGRALAGVLPNIRAYDVDGREIHWVGEGRDISHASRLKAEWDAPITIVAAILTAVKKAKISEEDVKLVAQHSPQALEKLKEAGAAYKAHLNRFLDPVALRRDPRYGEVAARYKAEIRSLVAEQQAKIVEARKVTRRLNQLLGQRDEELAKLDPGFTPKRATAAAELAKFGITLEEGEEAESAEAGLTAQMLEDLNF
ncbi:hypothetical protein [Ustilaginoidea virens unassigned RNA virus HNND-1]|uniref:Uncharacterized protein n=1 Tax=Ustilaginoidea virens unassigned RNA virus HNND-1 TaxID=1670975 RepID=A0A0G3ZCM4_9VIRU|nr:hypothetical protein [Ustilaginoidea virens unassigned RNA virus HNND-1]AKM52548.1 hypothetical protein [Ustilaginoidea virens unassigned RNA virus HNND-1]